MELLILAFIVTIVGYVIFKDRANDTVVVRELLAHLDYPPGRLK